MYPTRNAILCFAVLLTFPACTGKGESTSSPTCDLHTAFCQSNLADGSVIRLNVFPKPVKAMQELEFEVQIEEPAGRTTAVTIDLTMPEMYMGENRISLHRIADGRFIGKGTIVKCTSGDRIWDAGVTVERKDRRNTVHFRFDVMP